ncbi:hypothetical protein AB0A71_34460 [Kitasatospora aureofaciens]|uniref:hypothetical protein n=1 Tax=Kitasatospora aureofaciens TaxID=1894 RepID=UPI00340F7857
MTLPAALVGLIIAIILVRSGRSPLALALAAATTGFLLASSSLTPTISGLLTSIGSALSRIA